MATVDDADFAEATLASTGGRGADAILELVGAPHFPRNIDTLARKGRVVIVGVGAGTDVKLSLLSLMQKRATLRGTVLRARPLHEKAAVVAAFEAILTSATTDYRLAKSPAFAFGRETDRQADSIPPLVSLPMVASR